MNPTLTRFKNLGFHLKSLRFALIVKKLRFRLYTDSTSYCLRRDLAVPFTPPEARIPLTVRPMTETDAAAVFNMKASGLSRIDRQELHERLLHWRTGITTAYIALTEQGNPAYIQWLMGPEGNDAIRAYFNGTFPVLGPDEALLENAFTLPACRSKGIMPAAMARIAEEGKKFGGRYIITFVEDGNIPSLKGCKRAGFYPYMLRRERWVLFYRRLEFTKLEEGARYPFEINSSTVETVG